jgi:hypothetical protein
MNPQPAPSNADLRQRRNTLGVTLASTAGALGQRPSVIFLHERGLFRNDDLAMTSHQWLTEQPDAIQFNELRQ